MPVWIPAWIAVATYPGLLFCFDGLLFGFLFAHVANHNLAVWSVELHTAALQWLYAKWLVVVLATHCDPLRLALKRQR